MTIVKNNEANIENTIQSALSQDYPNLEYIVIDGKSEDKTTQIINNYSKSIDKIISEPDKGIYDALNKGLGNASGEIIGFLHSDDIFSNTRIVSEIANMFAKTNTDIVYGDISYIRKNKMIHRKWVSGNFSSWKLYFGWMPPHTGVFIKKNFYLDNNLNFNLNYKISADYDLLIRALKIQDLKISYIQQNIVNMLLGGASNRNLKSILIKIIEDYKIVKANNVGGVITIFFKNIIKIKQFF